MPEVELCSGGVEDDHTIKSRLPAAVVLDAGNTCVQGARLAGGESRNSADGREHHSEQSLLDIMKLMSTVW